MGASRTDSSGSASRPSRTRSAANGDRTSAPELREPKRGSQMHAEKATEKRGSLRNWPNSVPNESNTSNRATGLQERQDNRFGSLLFHPINPVILSAFFWFIGRFQVVRSTGLLRSRRFKRRSDPRVSVAVLRVHPRFTLWFSHVAKFPMSPK